MIQVSFSSSHRAVSPPTPTLRNKTWSLQKKQVRELDFALLCDILHDKVNSINTMLLKGSHFLPTFTTSFLLLSLKWAVPTTYTLEPSSVSSSVTVLGKEGFFCLFFIFISRRILNASASARKGKKKKKKSAHDYEMQVKTTENKNVTTKQQSRAKRPWFTTVILHSILRLHHWECHHWRGCLQAWVSVQVSYPVDTGTGCPRSSVREREKLCGRWGG